MCGVLVASCGKKEGATQRCLILFNFFVSKKASWDGLTFLSFFCVCVWLPDLILWELDSIKTIFLTVLVRRLEVEQSAGSAPTINDVLWVVHIWHGLINQCVARLMLWVIHLHGIVAKVSQCGPSCHREQLVDLNLLLFLCTQWLHHRVEALPSNCDVHTLTHL